MSKDGVQRAGTFSYSKKTGESFEKEKRNTMTSLTLRHNIPHLLKNEILLTPASCSFCRKFIWGVGKQAMKCEACNQYYHENCSKCISEDCGLSFDMLARALTMTDLTKNPSTESLDLPKTFPTEFINDHIFKLHTYKSPTWCSHCTKFIWGLANQGWKCQKCSRDCHTRCREKISKCVPYGGHLPQGNSKTQLTIESRSQVQEKRKEFGKKNFSKISQLKFNLNQNPNQNLNPNPNGFTSHHSSSSRSSLDSKDESRHVPLAKDEEFVNKLEKSESFREAFESGYEAKKRNQEADEKSIEEEQIELEYKFEDFEILEKVLGRGQFGVVKQAKIKDSEKIVAVKIIDRRSFWGKKQTARNMKREIAILSSLKHPGIIELYTVSEDKNSLYLFMEYVEGGDLLTYVEKRGHLDEDESKFILHQICMGVKYLHDNGITHRDLKPENLLLLDEDGVKRVKIADFGFANIVGEASFLKSVVGTPAYLAPEITKNKGYNKSADMWSIGVIMYACMSGVFPFDENEPPEDQIKSKKFGFPDEYWKNISDEAVDLCCRLLVPDPQHRLTIDVMLAHPWFSTLKQLKI